ncbi:MAG TPA: hypothetical protein VGH42_02985 [Verrucomicrobiae bacterium]|jgi:hypothetical protein
MGRNKLQQRMKIFFKTNLNLEELATAIRKILNIPTTNRSRIVQARDGLNIGGGQYFYFETFGLELFLIRNAGEVLVPEMADYNFYFYAQNPKNLHQDLSEITNHLAQVFKNEEFEIEIEEPGI